MSTRFNVDGSPVERIVNPRIPGPRSLYPKEFHEPSRTHAEDAESCDINNIVKRFLKTGHISHVQRGTPMYGDFSHATDFQEAVDRVAAAEAAFMTMPARVRALAENDPGKLLELLDQVDAGGDLGDELRAELEEAGLSFEPPAEPAPRSAEGRREPSSEGPTDPAPSEPSEPPAPAEGA